MRAWLLALVLVACAADAAPEAESVVDEPESSVAMFAEVLAQHQALNRRVERVGHRLLTANAHLCPDTRRTLGMSVHSVADYPESLRDLAGELLDVDEGMSVRSVVADGPAARAGVRAGDRVQGLGGMPINGGVTAPRYWRMAQERTREDETAELIVSRDGERLELDIVTEPACNYRTLVEFSSAPNAYADGKALVITSEFVRRTDSDARLALILAHELAHSIAHSDVLGGSGQTTHALEFDADAKGLVMTANASFSMDRAVDGMEAFSRGLVIPDTPTHPAHARRVKRLRALVDVLKGKKGLLELEDGVSPKPD